MGIAVELGPEGVARCIREAGVGFMMAPRYHPAMAAVVPVRRSLKVRCSHASLMRQGVPASVVRCRMTGDA